MIPWRRPCLTQDVGDFAVTVGFHPETGFPIDMFVSKRCKSGTGFEQWQYDMGVTASKLMQGE